MPGAGIGVQLVLVQGKVRRHAQARLGAKDRDAVDPAPRPGHVFLEPPAQTAEEIHLPLFRGPVLRGVLAGQRVIARPVQPGIVQRHRVRPGSQVAGIKVDDIGQHGGTAFLGVKGQHLADPARFAKRKEQVFGVVAGMNPGACDAVHHQVQRGGQRRLGEHVVGHHLHPIGQVRRDLQPVGRQQDHIAKPQFQMMRQGAVDLDRVLGCDDGQGAGGKRRGLGIQKGGQGRIAHRTLSTIAGKVGD